MTITLMVDLNMADGVYLDVFLEPETYLSGSPALPPEMGEWIDVVGEGGIRCRAIVESVDGPIAVVKLDMSTWDERPEPAYQHNPFGDPPNEFITKLSIEQKV